jgi:hypothetical protein
MRQSDAPCPALLAGAGSGPRRAATRSREEFVLLPAPRQRTWRTLHNSGCGSHLTLRELLVRQVELDAIGRAIPIMVTVPLPMGSMYLAEHEPPPKMSFTTSKES